MAASYSDLIDMFRRGQDREDTPTHMVVVCDSFDYEDYPVYTSDPAATVKKYEAKSMQRVMEVYDLRKPFDRQRSHPHNARLAWDFGGSEKEEV